MSHTGVFLHAYVCAHVCARIGVCVCMCVRVCTSCHTYKLLTCIYVSELICCNLRFMAQIYECVYAGVRARAWVCVRVRVRVCACVRVMSHMRTICGVATISRIL